MATVQNIDLDTAKQLNFDDVYGTHIGFKEEDEKFVESTPSDFEVFKALISKTQFPCDFPERSGVVQMSEMGDIFDVVTKEIVLVETPEVRTVAMFCESDESFLGFLTETVNQRMRPKR